MSEIILVSIIGLMLIIVLVVLGKGQKIIVENQIVIARKLDKMSRSNNE